MKQTEQLWDQKATDWAERSDMMWTQGSRKTIIPFLKSVITAGKMLDLGCGDGAACRLLEDSFDMTGLDLSEEMIRIARDKSPTLDFVVGTGEALPFVDHAFDAVLAVNSLEWSTRPLTVLQEIERVAPLVIISLLGPTAAPRALAYRRLHGEDAPMGNTMMPWELVQLAEELGWTLLDEAVIQKEGAVLTGHRLLDQAHAFSCLFAFRTRN
ncbi:class I SAM-dependent methyltransferase [Exiguobacterium oxidotolerans]|uniref:class I SAM-dependent methyltransferase n=1 Tax=Exiguobacterium oxidotolerans TaxID=223958 RepID=UPI0004949728|nr:class I SAM-dependent methyltransferase [Exiguobacterium oxidotolerans]